MKTTRRIQLAIATVLGLSAAQTFAGSDTWNQPAVGTHSWNDGANWLSGVQFPNGVDDTATLTTTLPTGTTTVNLNQNITLGTLSMGRASQTLTIAGGTPAGRLIFDVSSGSAALNILAGAGNTISAGIVLADPLVVDNAVAGTLSGGIFGYGNVTKQGAGTLTINGTSSLFGNVNITQGTLGFGTTGLNANNTVNIPSGTLTFSETATVRNIGGLTGAGNVTGTGTNEKRLAINNSVANVFTGNINYANGASSGNQLIKNGVGDFSLSGASGSFTRGSGTTTLFVNNGRFILDNATNNNTDRITDAITMTLARGGEFTLLGNASTASSEQLAGLTIGATATGNGAYATPGGKVTILPGSGQTGTLTFSAFTRTSNVGSVLFRGTNLGSDSGAFSQAKFTTGPTLVGGAFAANQNTPAVGIINGAFGATSATGDATGLVTYDDTVGTGVGVRLLNVNEYADYAAAGTSTNALITSGGTITGKVVNSLTINNTSGSLLTATLDNSNLAPTSGTFVFSGNASNPITLTKGAGTGTINLAPLATFSVLTTAGTVATIDAPIRLDFTGNLGAFLGLAKDGGETLVLKQNLTFTPVKLSQGSGAGIIAINAGTLKAGAAGIVGFNAPDQSNNGGVSMTIASGATFDMNGFNQTFSDRTKLDAQVGSVIVNTGANAILNPNSGGSARAGSVTLAGTITDGTPLNGATDGLVSLNWSGSFDGGALNIVRGGNILLNLTVGNGNTFSTGTATLNSLSLSDSNTIHGAIAVGGGSGSATSVLVANTIGNGTSQATTLGTAAITLNRNGRLTINSRGDTAALSGQTVTWANNIAANEGGGITVGSADSGVSTGVTQKLGALTISGATRTFTATANDSYTLEFAGATTLTNTVATTNTLNVTAGTLKLADIGQSGTGNKGLIKVGAGTLHVKAGSTQSYLGTTAVTNGVFLMNGTSSGQDHWTVYGVGLLGGTGSIGLASGKSVTVGGASAGVLAPGNASIGTLSVNGAVVFDNLGTLRAEIGAAGASDLVAVTGNLELKAGATLDLLPLAGAWSGGVYTLATCTGSRTGTFTTVNGLDSRYTVQYGANRITLGPAGTVIAIR